MNRILLYVLTLICLLPLSQVFAEESKAGDREWKIINYWSITCAPCRIEIPELNRLHEELESVDILLVGVNFDEDERGRTLMLAERMGIEFPTLTQAQVDALGVVPPNVLPTTLILSPGGIEKARLVGAQTGETIKDELGQLIGAGK